MVSEDVAIARAFVADITLVVAGVPAVVVAIVVSETVAFAEA